MNSKHITQYTLGSVYLRPVNREGAIEIISERWKEQQSTWVMTLNPEHILYAENHPQFNHLINDSTIHLIDGIGLKWALQLRSNSKHIPKVTGIDFIDDTLRTCSTKRILLYGATRDTLLNAAKKLIIKHRIKRTNLAIIDGYKSDEEVGRVIERFDPEVILVGLGSPKQDKWISKEMSKSDSPRLYIGVGGAFDIIGGKFPRAPLLFRKLQLEWLWRVVVQPSRLPRIINAAIRFPIFVLHGKHNSSKN